MFSMKVSIKFEFVRAKSWRKWIIKIACLIEFQLLSFWMCRKWRPVGRWVYFSAKKKFGFFVQWCVQRGCCLLKVPWKTRKIDDLSKLKFHKLSKLPDRQNWKTQDWKRQLDEKSKLFFCMHDKIKSCSPDLEL